MPQCAVPTHLPSKHTDITHADRSWMVFARDGVPLPGMGVPPEVAPAVAPAVAPPARLPPLLPPPPVEPRLHRVSRPSWDATMTWSPPAAHHRDVTLPEWRPRHRDGSCRERLRETGGGRAATEGAGSLFGTSPSSGLGVGPDSLKVPDSRPPEHSKTSKLIVGLAPPIAQPCAPLPPAPRPPAPDAAALCIIQLMPDLYRREHDGLCGRELVWRACRYP